MSQPYYPQGNQPQVQVITQYQHQGDTAAQVNTSTYEHYKSKSSTILGWIQIVLAILCIIFNSVGIAVQRDRYDDNYTFYIGAGIWASVFFLISGGLALGAAKTKSKCLVISTLVLSIISALFGFVLMGWAAAAVGTDNDNRNSGSYYNDFYYYALSYYNPWGHDDKTSYAMGVLILIFSFALIIVSIWTSALGCAACCCGPFPGRSNTRAQVIYPAVVYYGQPGMFMTTTSQNININAGGGYGNYQPPQQPQQPPAYINQPPTYTAQQGPAQVHMPQPIPGHSAQPPAYQPQPNQAAHPSAPQDKNRMTYVD